MLVRRMVSLMNFRSEVVTLQFGLRDVPGAQVAWQAHVYER